MRMLNQRAEINRLLRLTGLDDEWQVVESNPDAKVVLQNEEGLKVQIPLSTADINEIHEDDTKISRLRLALTGALVLAHVRRIETPRYS